MRTLAFSLLLAGCAVESGAAPTLANLVEQPQAEAQVAMATPAPSAMAEVGAALPATLVASASAASSAPTEASDPLVITLPREPLTIDFKKRPFVFTAAFDGSLRFSLWLRTIEHARSMKKKYGKGPHYTFFVNAAFYTTSAGQSDVGKAMSHNEVLVRRALTQQAINEGHDIADHGMGHHDGRNWSKEQWLAEFALFHGVMDAALFQPVAAEGGFAFPRFEPIEGTAEGELGAACDQNDDCSSKRCAALTETVGLCTQPCNLKAKCPSGTACGAPMFREDTDLCIPIPKFPLLADGKVMFDKQGEPNLKHTKLVPYAIKGFRAPYLAANNALYDALSELGYQYDTSQSAGPGPPFFMVPATQKQKLLELALIFYPGAAAIPMDYNYAKRKITRERMAADYKAAIDGSLENGNQPWNVGHHFAMWHDGAYLEVLEETVEYVLAGCKDATGTVRCAGSEVLSFRELAKQLIAAEAR